MFEVHNFLMRDGTHHAKVFYAGGWRPCEMTEDEAAVTFTCFNTTIAEKVTYCYSWDKGIPADVERVDVFKRKGWQFTNYFEHKQR